MIFWWSMQKRTLVEFSTLWLSFLHGSADTLNTYVVARTPIQQCANVFIACLSTPVTLALYQHLRWLCRCNKDIITAPRRAFRQEGVDPHYSSVSKFAPRHHIIRIRWILLHNVVRVSPRTLQKSFWRKVSSAPCVYMCVFILLCVNVYFISWVTSS